MKQFLFLIFALLILVVTVNAHAQGADKRIQDADIRCFKNKNSSSCITDNTCLFSARNQCIANPALFQPTPPPPPRVTPSATSNIDSQLNNFIINIKEQEKKSLRLNEDSKNQQFAAIRKSTDTTKSKNNRLVEVQEQTNRGVRNIQQLFEARAACAYHHHKLRPFRGLDHCERNYETRSWFR